MGEGDGEGVVTLGGKVRGTRFAGRLYFLCDLVKACRCWGFYKIQVSGPERFCRRMGFLCTSAEVVQGDIFPILLTLRAVWESVRARRIPAVCPISW